MNAMYTNQMAQPLANFWFQFFYDICDQSGAAKLWDILYNNVNIFSLQRFGSYYPKNK